MVVEQFRNNDPTPIGNRFAARGRMLPDGVAYHASWVDPVHMRCYQVMEAPDAERLADWTARWDDLVAFEVVPVLPSHDFWSRQSPA